MTVPAFGAVYLGAMKPLFVAFAIGVVLLAAACAGSQQTRSVATRSVPRGKAPMPIRCPAHAPQLGGQVETRRPRAPCRSRGSAGRSLPLHGLNAVPRLGLARKRSVRNRRTIQALTRRINSLPRQRPAIYACPFDDGSEVLIVFGYPDRGNERVTVGLRGCSSVHDGKVVTSALPSRDGAGLLSLLRALTSASRGS